MKLLFALFSVAVARYADGVHANSYNEVRALWQAKGAMLQSISTMRAFHTLSTPAQQQQCQTSFEAFQAVAQTCLPSVSTIFEPTSDDNSSTVHAKIEAYCAPNACSSQMKTAVEALRTDCIVTGVFGEICQARATETECTSNNTLCSWLTPPGTAGVCRINVDFFATLRMILGVFCLQSSAAPTKYCVPSFYDFVKTKQSNVPADVAAQLTAGCDDCTLKIFRVWSRVEPLRAAVHFIQLANLCLRRNGKFCAVHQMELQATHLRAGADCKTFTDELLCKNATRGCRWADSKCEDLWTNEKLAPVCHPCTLVYAHRALFAFRLMDQFQLPDPNNERRLAQGVLGALSFTVNGVCSTNLKDEFCLPKLQAQNSDFTCTGMATTLRNVGCCAPSLIDFAQGLCSVDKIINTASTCQVGIDAINNQIAMCPGLNLGKTCAQLKFLLVHEAIVSGIAPEWVAANKDRLVDELKKIIAFAMGVDIALIAEVKVVAATNAGRRLLAAGDLQVTTTVSVPNAGAGQSAMEGLTGELDSLGLNDAIQSTTPSGTLGTPTITGQSTTNVAVVPRENNSNGASSATPLLALVAAVVGMFCL